MHVALDEAAPERAGVPGVLGLPGERVAVHWTGIKASEEEYRSALSRYAEKPPGGRAPEIVHHDLFSGADDPGRLFSEHSGPTAGFDHLGTLLHDDLGSRFGGLDRVEDQAPAPIPALTRGDRVAIAKADLLHDFTDRFNYEDRLALHLDRADWQFQEAEVDRGILRSRQGLDIGLSDDGRAAVLTAFQDDVKTAFDGTHGTAGDGWRPSADAQAQFADHMDELVHDLPARFDRQAAYEQTVADARLRLAATEQQRYGADYELSRTQLFGPHRDTDPVRTGSERNWVGNGDDEFEEGADGVFRPKSGTGTVDTAAVVRTDESPHWAGLQRDLDEAFKDPQGAKGFEGWHSHPKMLSTDPPADH